MIPPERSAVHEAGHAVASALLGVRIERVVLHDGGGGTCELERFDIPRLKLLILAAGDIAEQKCRVPEGAGWRL